MFSKLREARDPTNYRDKAVKIAVKQQLGRSPSFRLGLAFDKENGLNRMLGVCNSYCPPSMLSKLNSEVNYDRFTV